MARLEIEGLTKRHGANLIVDNVSLRVEDGEFLALLGPSGGGKSTLLRLICGIDTPDAGRISIGGRDVTSLPARERNLGMVFQDYGLYPNMDVFGNIAYGLEARGGLSKAEIERRVTESAGRVGLAEHLRRAIVDLSGGEQQRVALARAMAKDADAYLFDEPLSNLDPKLRHQARRDILALHKAKGKPSLYVTHDQTEAFALGNRVAILARGRLQQVAPPETLLDRPANLYVAGFVGSPPMNLLHGNLGRAGETYTVAADGVTLTLPRHLSSAVERYGKGRIVAGLKPSALTPGASGEAQILRAEVLDVEPLIGETVLMLRAGADTRLSAVVGDDSADALTPGQAIDLVVDADQICLFDPETEQALA